MRISKELKVEVHLDSVDNPQPITDWSGKVTISPHRIEFTEREGNPAKWVIVYGQRILKSGAISDDRELFVTVDLVELTSISAPAPQWVRDIVEYSRNT